MIHKTRRNWGIWTAMWAIAGMQAAAGQSPLKAGADSLPDLVTDRPDFTEATQVVSPGLVQVEMGMTLSRVGGLRQLTEGELLTRIGLGRKLELRLGTDGRVSEKVSRESWQSGRSDFAAGVKVGIWEQGRWKPAFSVIPILSMPTGSAAFSSGAWEPTIKLALSKDLTAGFSLGGNANYSSLRADTGRMLQQAYSASVGHDLVAGFGAYWEVYAFSPWDEGKGAAWIVNSGVSHPVGLNAQFDVRVGKAITASGPNWFAGVGFAIRQRTGWFKR